MEQGLVRHLDSLSARRLVPIADKKARIDQRPYQRLGFGSHVGEERPPSSVGGVHARFDQVQEHFAGDFPVLGSNRFLGALGNGALQATDTVIGIVREPGT